MNKIIKRLEISTITITLILVCIFLLACTGEIKEIYEGLKNKDKDRIKSVFSENQLMNHSRKIDRKIDEVYEFIDGEIVEYKEITGSCGSGERRYYEWIYRYFDGYIIGIKTDTGREYTIDYGGYLVDKNDSDNIGISYFVIWEEDSESDERILVGTVD